MLSNFALSAADIRPFEVGVAGISLSSLYIHWPSLTTSAQPFWLTSLSGMGSSPAADVINVVSPLDVVDMIVTVIFPSRATP